MARDAPTAPSRAELAGLTGILVAGLVVRALWLHDASLLPFFWRPQTDDFVYTHGAARITAADFWLRGEPLRFGPPYFYFLALVGDEGIAPRISQIAIGLCVVPCVWWTTRALTRSTPSALVAAALAAFYGPAIFFEALFLPETLMMALDAALAAALVHAITSRSLRAWGTVGAFAGAAIAFRPNALLSIPVLLFFASRSAVDAEPPRDRARRVVAVVGAALVALSPLAVRNLIAIGTPFGASTAGINAFIGNGPGATGIFRIPPEVPGATSPEGQFTAFRQAAARALGHDVSDAEADRYWLGRTLDHVGSHPLHALELFARKLRLFWNARELSNLVDYEFLGSLGNTLSAPLVQFAWIAPLGFAGMFLLASRQRSPEERVLAWLLVSGCASVVLVFVQDRYRLPLVPWVIVAAVCAAKILVDHARSRRWRALSIASMPLALGLALALPPVALRPHPERQWTQLGDGYRSLHRDSDACAAYRRALGFDSSFEAAQTGVQAACP